MNKEDLKDELNKLDLTELNSLVQFVKDKKLLNDYTKILIDALEAKYQDAFVCPICGSVRINKSGHYKNSSQKWICKECGATFPSTKGTILENTKLDPLVWLKYLIIMSEDEDIRDCAQYAGVSVKGSFYMRHKILNALAHRMGNVELKGIVELDEMSVNISYSGNYQRQDNTKELPSKVLSKRKKREKA